jgi:hypothetical protein
MDLIKRMQTVRCADQFPRGQNFIARIAVEATIAVQGIAMLGPASTLVTMNFPLLRFTDGVTRVVYTDLRGQYVLDY